MKNRKMVIVGEVFSSNLGDYAIFDSLCSILKLNNVEAIPLDLSLRKGFNTGNNLLGNDKNQKKGKLLSLNKLKYSKTFQYFISRGMWHYLNKPKANEYWASLIKDADAVIVGGGQLITDSPAYFSSKISLIIDIAYQNNKPVAIIGCGVGNNLGYVAKKEFKKIVDACCYVSLRDTESRNRLYSFISKDNLAYVYPDMAFALEMKNITNKSNICGLNIIPLSFFQKYNSLLNDMSEHDYILFWIRIAKEAIREGMNVVLMTNGSPQDYQQARVIHKAINEQGLNVKLLDRPKQPVDLYQQISNIDYLVATRMHAGIVGQALGCTVATIIWDDKILGVWNTVGYEGVAVDSMVLKSENAWEKINNSFKHSEIVSAQKAQISDKVVDSVDRCLKAIFNEDI